MWKDRRGFTLLGRRLGTFLGFLASSVVLVGIIVLMGQKVLVFIISGMLIQSVLFIVYSVILCSPYPFELYKNIS